CTLEPNSIAGDIDQITRLVDAEGKSNHVTSVDSDRTVAGWGCGHEELLAANGLERARLKWCQTDSISAEALRSRVCCVSQADTRQKGASGVIEIIEMMVVAQQHRVEPAYLLDRKGGPFRLDVFHRAVWSLILSRRVKGGIGQQANVVILNED